MKRLSMLCGLILALAAGPAMAETFDQVQVDKSRIGFTFTEMGVPIQGGFSRFAAQLAFDPARPAAAHAAIDIDLASIDAGSQEANDEVPGKTWFDTKHFPKARFQSSAVRALGGNRYEALGTLTIKGRTRNVVAPFSYAKQGAVARFDGSLTIRRVDFAIGEGEWADFSVVANDVRIDFHIQAVAGAAAGK